MIVWGRVTLLAEGVDRNIACPVIPVILVVSPSSRRVWIETDTNGWETPIRLVTLLAEGVDRNDSLDPRDKQTLRHPPRGGCG